MKTIEELLTDAKNHRMIEFLYKNQKKLVLYGASSACDGFLKQAARYDLPIDCIIDSNPAKKGENLHEIEIKHVDEILPEIKQLKFLITTSYVYSVIEFLHSKGVADEDIYVPNRYDIYTGRFGGFPYYHAYLSPVDIYLNKEHYLNAYNLLCDDKSKKIFCTLLQYRLYGTYCIDGAIYNEDMSYFNNDFVHLGTDEYFCDIGALEGDSIIGFIEKCNNQYKKIYAIEANQSACKKMKERIINDRNKDSIEILNFGVGEKRETISYDGFTSYQGNEKLEIFPLDEILKNKPVTIIKMDIEGMELDAIRGGINIIQTQKPVLAICIYHLVTDIWEIIEYLHSILPEYKFCIEQPFHTYMIETVLYAFLP